MKAYGYNVHRNGTKFQRFACCDTRNKCKGCLSRGKDPSDRCFKRRARAAGKAEAKAQVD